MIRLIDDMSEQSSLLALNASLQAATAGEAGRGFAAIASEFEHLAERSAFTVRKIGASLKAIRSETTDAVAAMEQNMGNLNDGTASVSGTAATLVQMETTINQAADLSERISTSADLMKHNLSDLSASLAETGPSKDQAASGTHDVFAAVERLMALANELRLIAGAFQLPTDGPRSTIGVPTARRQPLAGKMFQGS